jgi:hypothetical protein
MAARYGPSDHLAVRGAVVGRRLGQQEALKRRHQSLQPASFRGLSSIAEGLVPSPSELMQVPESGKRRQKIALLLQRIDAVVYRVGPAEIHLGRLAADPLRTCSLPPADGRHRGMVGMELSEGLGAGGLLLTCDPL